MSRNGKNVCVLAFQVARTKVVAYTRADLMILERKEVLWRTATEKENLTTEDTKSPARRSRNQNDRLVSLV